MMIDSNIISDDNSNDDSNDDSDDELEKLVKKIIEIVGDNYYEAGVDFSYRDFKSAEEKSMKEIIDLLRGR